MKRRLNLLFLLVTLLLLLQFGCSKPDAPDTANPKATTELPVKTWDASPIETITGNIDYVFRGCSFTSTETSCDNLKKGTIAISIPSGVKIKRAYLLWSGSGTNDTQVTLDGNKACTSAKTQIADGEDGYIWYKNYCDVTSYISSKGSGVYTVSDLTYNAGGTYCSSWSTVGIASIVVVYEQVSLPLCDIHVYMPDLCDIQYPNQLVKENYHIPQNGSCAACIEKDVTICLNWCEGDGYKNEYCKLGDNDLGANTLNGSEAPNLDIDTYTGYTMPANRTIPLEFKGYWIPGYLNRYEAAYMQCVVIKVKKGDNGNVCSCLTGEDGKPLTNFSFQLKDSTGKTTTVTTDAYGNWCQSLLKGKYQLLLDTTKYKLSTPFSFNVIACTCTTLPCAKVIRIPPTGCADADKDGVCDNVDVCPSDPGPPENNGCPQIIFSSAGDITYNANYVSMQKSASNNTLTNVVATTTQTDQTNLNQYYILSIGDFVPTVGQTYTVKSVALKNTPNYGSILSKTFNINTKATVDYYNAASHYIKLRFSGTFEEQGLSNTRTFNINGTVTTKYIP